jgi:hypothetical protein
MKTGSRLPAEEKARWQAAAGSEGLSEFVRRVVNERLDEPADEEPGVPEPGPAEQPTSCNPEVVADAPPSWACQDCGTTESSRKSFARPDLCRDCTSRRV